MYYIGTEAECLAYNEEVAAGHNFDMVNCLRWSDITAHKDGNLFAIVAHPDYPSDLESLEALPIDWFNEEE